MNFKSLLIKASTFVFAATCFINSANAGIITQDDVLAGDLQGLEWLTWDETFGENYTSVSNGFGGFFDDGWRYATGSEFAGLLTSFNIAKGWSANNPVQQLRDIFFTDHVGSFLAILGAENECGAGVVCDEYIDFYGLASNAGYVHYGPGVYGSETSVDATRVDMSSILVRAIQAPAVDTPEVPEPSTLAIFALGLLGLSARKLKKS